MREHRDATRLWRLAHQLVLLRLMRSLRGDRMLLVLPLLIYALTRIPLEHQPMALVRHSGWVVGLLALGISAFTDPQPDEVTYLRSMGVSPPEVAALHLLRTWTYHALYLAGAVAALFWGWLGGQLTGVGLLLALAGMLAGAAAATATGQALWTLHRPAAMGCLALGALAGVLLWFGPGLHWLAFLPLLVLQHRLYPQALPTAATPGHGRPWLGRQTGWLVSRLLPGRLAWARELRLLLRQRHVHAILTLWKPLVVGVTLFLPWLRPFELRVVLTLGGIAALIGADLFILHAVAAEVRGSWSYACASRPLGRILLPKLLMGTLLCGWVVVGTTLPPLIRDGAPPAVALAVELTLLTYAAGLCALAAFFSVRYAGFHRAANAIKITTPGWAGAAGAALAYALIWLIYPAAGPVAAAVSVAACVVWLGPTRRFVTLPAWRRLIRPWPGPSSK